MVDVHTQEQRRYNMSRIRSEHTSPELAVRRALHSLGHRFRLHRKDLPGTPDIVLPKYRTVIFVHGCFWHRHYGCRFSTTPKTRSDFWQKKLEANAGRDQRIASILSELGWKVIVVWECETRDSGALLGMLRVVLPTVSAGSTMGDAAGPPTH